MSKQHNRKGCYDNVILPSSGREAICAHWPCADTGLTSTIKREETISASPQQVSLRLQHVKQVILQWMGYKSDLLIHRKALIWTAFSCPHCIEQPIGFLSERKKVTIAKLPLKKSRTRQERRRGGDLQVKLPLFVIAPMLQRIAAGW